jgi:uncharacterized protein
MDTILIILGLVCMIVGVFGSFMPAMPGPGISWLGILLLYLTNAIENNYWVLGITLLLTIGISVLDYVIPAKGTKHFGGTKYGIWGTNIGMLLGFFFIPLPFGFIIGAFLGAFLGEIYVNSKDKNRALKAATGSILGFLASSFVKFIFCIVFLGLYLVLVWYNRAELFVN